MKHCARIAAIVFVIAGMASAMAAQLSPSNPNEKPAGCHQHGKKSPVRQPADYKCCVAGHDAALLRTTVTPHPISQISTANPLAVPVIAQIIGLTPSIAMIQLNPASRAVPLRV